MDTNPKSGINIKTLLVGCIVSLVLLVSGCQSKENQLFKENVIFERYEEHLKSGFANLTGDQLSFQEAVFEYDDDAIIFVDQYIDDDFIPYEHSDDLEIYLIHFEDYVSYLKLVSFKTFQQEFEVYAEKPFFAAIHDDRISALIERHVP